MILNILSDFKGTKDKTRKPLKTPTTPQGSI